MPGCSRQQARLRDCAFGDVLILGDSQAEAAIIPAGLAIPTWNLALGGASPIETWHVVHRALRCPHRPRLALYTHGLPSFAAVGEALWKNAARFGAIDYRDLRAIAVLADGLHDRSISDRDLGDGLRGAVRDAAYSAGFPSVFLGSLLEANLFRRLDHNRAVLREAMAGSGHMRYLRPSGPLAALPPPPEAALTELHVPPVTAYYFHATLAALAAAGVPTVLLETPVPAEGLAVLDPAVRQEFANLLAEAVAAQPAMTALGSAPFEPWPERYFADAHHLDPSGAARFTGLLAPCLADWLTWTRAEGPPRQCRFALSASPIPTGQANALVPTPGGVAAPARATP
jgi:hypothetical protein